MFKRIAINLILIIMLLSFLEALCFFKAKADNIHFKARSDRLESNRTQSHVTQYNILSDFDTQISRPSYIKNSDKNPILWFGCSFAEGAGLDDEHTPCAKISNLTNRTCINRSKGATGMQYMYYQLLNENFYKEVPNADYIIYVYIYNHLQRLYNYQVNPLIDMFNLRYKISNGKLKEIKPFFKPFYSSYAVKRFLNTVVYLQAFKEEHDFKLFNAVMLDTIRITREHYPNLKIIMLEYPELMSRSIPPEEIEKLENMGVTVVRITDITKDVDIYDKKYWLPDNIHPNNEAWDLILPRIAEKYIN